MFAANREYSAIRVAGATAPVVNPARRRATGLFSIRPEGLLPDRSPGFAVQRDHETVCVLCIQHAVDHDGRRAQVRVRPCLGERGDQLVVHRRAPPGNAQTLDVVAIDLIEGGVSGEPLVAAVVAPFGLLALTLDWLGHPRARRAMIRATGGLGVRSNDRNGGRDARTGSDGQKWLGVCHGSVPGPEYTDHSQRVARSRATPARRRSC